MSSKELAKVLIDPFRDEDLKYYGYVEVTKEELDKLQENIEIFLLRKFEEGMHVGRDHDSLGSNGGDGVFNEKK